ncbi:MAG: UDP-glucose/GDP-mannose dehydrogenase family protein [Actinomycetota bacterium]|nr:UDP-glucose/GDP-mannose dehydrogenase family protein [Actinomycetota bacterium]
MRVAIVGTGHVGLVTGVALASLGHDVIGTDANPERVDSLREGRLPFSEPGLEDLFHEGVEAGRLRFTDSIAEAVEQAEAVMVCVGRPPVGSGDKSLVAVESAVRDIARHATPGVVVVVKSTVPPGTTARIEQTIKLERPDLDFAIVSSPEFLREGHAIEDTLEPERLVAGSDSEHGLAAIRQLYAPLLAEGRRLIETDPRSAELSKLASNSFLALKISFANALARVSERSGADVTEVMTIVGADSRIGPAFLGAGLGFGGYCLPKDIVTLERVADRLGYDFRLLKEATRINEEALEAVARKVEEAVWHLEDKRVALLGVAFKAGIDDVRGAPALALARRLIAEGAEVVAWDPMAAEAARREVPELSIATDPADAATGAHCLVICTEWPELQELDLEQLRMVMAYPVIVDGRNALDGARARGAGLTYMSVGRGAEAQPAH